MTASKTVARTKISTTVRSLASLYAIRIGFAVGSRLLPDSTLARAARLFTTPFASSRRRALATDPLDAREARIAGPDGVPVATYVWGDPAREPYVLFSHGWSSHGTRITPWLPALRAAGYAVVAFDQPGHGRSGGQYITLPGFADTLTAVGRHYGPAAAVIGHSLGGAAAAVALSRGMVAERAILIAPAADPLAAMERFSRMVWLAEGFARRMGAWFERQTRIPMDELQAHRAAPRIGRPALIVHDVEDREVPWAEGERYARFWQGARLLSTRGLGHNRVVEHPAVIADALRFLRDEPVGDAVVSSPNLPYGVC